MVSNVWCCSQHCSPAVPANPVNTATPASTTRPQNHTPNQYQHLGDIGSNSGLNIIVEHNDNPFYNASHIKGNNTNLNNDNLNNDNYNKLNKNKNKKNQPQEITESMRKLNIMSSLDKYLQ